MSYRLTKAQKDYIETCVSDAEAALDGYRCERYGKDRQTAIQDLISDLLHLAVTQFKKQSKKEEVAETILRLAQNNFVSETLGID